MGENGGRKPERYRFLTRDEERDLAVRAQRGDEAAVDRLVESQQAWAKSLALRFCRRSGWNNLDDAIGAAYLALVRAVRFFDPARGARLSTYATWAIIRELRSARVRDEVIRPPYARPGDAPEVMRLADCLDGVIPIAELLVDQRTDYRAPLQMPAGFGDLVDRTRAILIAYYFRGETLKTIGDRWGITRERVRQIREAGLAQLRGAADGSKT